MTMPTLPNPPTDNLYKFCALTGTVIFILSLYFPPKVRFEISEKLESLSLKVKVAQIERTYWDEKANMIEEILKDAINQQNGVSKVDKNKLAISYGVSELKQMLPDLADGTRNVRIKEAELETLDHEIARLASNARLVGFVSVFSLALGLVLGIFGYWNWYFRIQKYLDFAAKGP